MRAGNPDSPRGEMWREAFAEAQAETDPARQLELIAKARRMIQDVDIAAAGQRPDPEQQAALDHALRRLWVLEQDALKRTS